MWKELKIEDIDLLKKYHEVMSQMDKWYAGYSLERYKKFIRRGDKGYYWTDGIIDYFLMFHWNTVSRLWKLQCVGFTGTTDTRRMARLCADKMKEFMIENNLTQMYAVRPKNMDNPLINEHHTFLMASIGYIETTVQKETDADYHVSFVQSPQLIA